MKNLLYELIIMTMMGSLIFIIFKVTERITKKLFSASWHYGVLKFVILFFCLPFGKLYLFFANSNQIRSIFHIDSNASGQSVGSVVDLVHKISDYEILQGKLKLYELILLLWIVGISILLLRQILCFIKFRYIIACNKKVANTQLQEIAKICGDKQGIKKPIQLYINENITTPMLVGFFSPIILLPSDKLDLKLAEHVVSHELTHFRYKDLILKLAILLIRIIHWFNPFAYLLSREVDKWCEYTCDERNVIHLSHDLKKQYGLAILEAIAVMPVYGSNFGTPFLLPKQNLKERLLFMLDVKIMKTKTRILSITFASLLLTFGVVTTFVAENESESFIREMNYSKKELINKKIIDTNYNEELLYQNSRIEEKMNEFLKDIE